MTARTDLARDYITAAETALREGDHGLAIRQLKAAVGTDPSHAIAHRASAISASLDRASLGLQTVRVAFLSDHLIGPIPHLLRAELLASDLVTEPFVPGFDVWQQEIADPASDLFAFQPDVVVLDFLLERLAPDLVHSFLSLSPARVEAELERCRDVILSALDTLRSRSQARLLLHSFCRPTQPVLGIYDRSASPGQLRSVDRLIHEVRSEAAKRENTYVLDTDLISARIGLSAFLDPRMYSVAKLPYSSAGLSHLAVEYGKYIRGFFGRSRKVLVLDADNTLWGGIVGEDGLDGILLDADGPGAGYLDLQRYVAELGRRGVVLALNSSNERVDVMEVFAKRKEMVLKEEDFAVIVATWNDKAENLISISRTLGLGLDSFVFVDDDPVQCARVRAALPEVAVVELTGEPFNHVTTLAYRGWFDALTLTDEDRRRNQLYKAEASRQEVERVSSSQKDFVESLNVQLFVSRLAPGGLARAASLTQRTNQFNLTTRRYTETDLALLLKDPSWSGFTVRLVDRFGDVGVVGLVLIGRDGTTAVIDTFLLSCRALRRRVEDAMISIAVSDARRAGAQRVVGVYRPTKKNGLAANFFSDHGFLRMDGSSPEEQKWCTEDAPPIPQQVTVTREAGW